MFKTVYCCGLDQPCKVYELPTNKSWKRLYFLDECPFCGHCIASLQECDKDGNIKILKRYSGTKAIRLRDKLTTKILLFPNKKGSIKNERIFYNNKGIIYNFNNQKVGINEDFLLKA